ncbi:MAG: hypothetical protein Q9168_001049 [Polycauliona sp. 1 TL-2023]
MCGIFFTYSSDSDVALSSELFDRLTRRGPDHVGRSSSKCSTGSIIFISSVLSLRGEGVVKQPLDDSHTGSVLCFNGEAWYLDNAVIPGNDTQVVFDLLLQATAEVDPLPLLGHRDPVGQAVVKALSRISGPYAFIYYEARHNQLFYGRDPMGRRSLLTYKGEESFMVSSVPFNAASGGTWTEVEANGIYAISSDFTMSMKALQSHIPWPIAENNSAPVREPRAFLVRRPTNILSQSQLSDISPLPAPSQVPLLRLGAPTVDALLKNLRLSLAVRVLGVPTPPFSNEASAKLAILFSGGLDCTLIARILHDLLPEDQGVDLLNVAFENPRVLKAAGATDNLTATAFSQCPDRVTGLRSYAELQRVCPGRQWQFVSIDVTYQEFTSDRPQIISLIHPHQTEMDLSIACALYFAARGSGSVCSDISGEVTSYTTSARILLSGLGADELFAGYTRHATAFARHGNEGLVNELELDYQRLGKRNLGRDDRVTSHWAREVRYPYLDEDFLRWTLSLPIWEKCGFGQPSSATGSSDQDDSLLLEPSKKLLRLLLWKLGMQSAAAEKKRAIQFGARSAKMELGKTKGTQIIF